MKSINFFRRIILFFLLLSSFLGFAQYTAIPDPNFEQALIDLNIDSGIIDGKVLTANIRNVKSLELQAKNISDLTGIEAFTKLEILNLGIFYTDYSKTNKISNLNLTNNIYLQSLTCSYNELSNLDLSKNIYLTSLYLDNNKLSSLDISKNTLLTTLNCGSNNLTSLDVSKNAFLSMLFCPENQLTALDVSKNLALTRLNFYNNKLSTLDISQNKKLVFLSCNNNPISNLDVSLAAELVGLECANSQLTNLNISTNTLLTSLDCRENKINVLDVSKNLKLIHLGCSSNQLTTIDISKNLVLQSLSINNNQLSNIDFSKNILLKDIDCGANNLSSVDVSKNNILEHLLVLDNHLSTLDVSNNPNLIYLNCQKNNLTNLDVSKNPNLYSFFSNNNQLTNLNLKNGQNAKLISLDFKSNSNLSCISVDNADYSNTKWSLFKDVGTSFSNNCNKISAIAPPVLTATGDQLYCPQSTINVVTSFTLTHDVTELGTQAAYIQISSGYSSGLDKLELSNSHPSITTSWDVTAGKLTLSSSSSGNVLYSDLEAAIKDVVFSNSSATASGTRTFSITIGQANYLPSTQHFYLYIPNLGITWTDAKTAAEVSTYYGLKGYLATILSADEAKLIGEQASGTGWIGGSDAETEGVWKWVTGPEAGTIFWNGLANGSTPNFAFWNTGEPNNQGGNEKYAHITQPGVGIKGSWNDLSNTGDPSGDYQPKGYVVEYGGMPGETPLQIAASTKITIPVATALTPNPVCDSGSFTINATGTTGATISWYDSAVGGTLLATGNSFTTATISTTTTYYVDAGCESNRKSVIATINITPTTPVATNTNYSNCGPGTVTLQASTNIGFINWYTTPTGGTSLHTGNNFTTPTISANTTYYAEASNNGCINPNRIPIAIKIYTPPVVTDENVALCQFQDVELDAGISGMTYMWNNGETTQTIIAKTGGTYTVDVTSPAPENCTSRKTIIVNEHQVPQIKKIDVNGTRVVIYLTKEEDYFEYSVDGINFQDSNVFYDVPGGLQTAYAREKSGCGGDSLDFIVLIFPPFFTPNNDSFNDLWEVTGMENYPQAQVTIFDRYGKFVAQLDASKMSWDGTLNKTPLPASDYWYALKIDDTKPILRGHFSLKR